jgi:hypothetical protein
MAKAKRAAKQGTGSDGRASSGGRTKLATTMKAAGRAHALQRAEALVALIRRRVATIVESFYDIGEALREMLDDKLYGVLGHASLEAFLLETKLIAPRQGEKLIAIVRHVSRATAIAQGQEKSYALLGYTAASAEPDTVESVVASGRLGGRAVDDLSVRDVKTETRRLNAAKRAATPAAKARAKADAALAKAVRAALKAAGLAVESVRVDAQGVTIGVTRRAAEKLVG